MKTVENGISLSLKYIVWSQFVCFFIVSKIQVTKDMGLDFIQILILPEINDIQPTYSIL